MKKKAKRMWEVTRRKPDKAVMYDITALFDGCISCVLLHNGHEVDPPTFGRVELSGWNHTLISQLFSLI